MEDMTEEALERETRRREEAEDQLGVETEALDRTTKEAKRRDAK